MSVRPRTPAIRPWAGLLAACLLPVGAAPAIAAARLNVLTTIAPIHSWVASVAGPDAQVDNLLPANVGPHSFQLRPLDLQRIRAADLIIANGLGLEDWLDKAIQGGSAQTTAPKVLKVSAGWSHELIHHLPVLHLDPPTPGSRDGTPDHAGPSASAPRAGETDLPNPHVWLDPLFARHAVSNILAALVQIDPAHTAGYTARAAAYQVRLADLDREIREGVTALSGKSIVTYHDAFPYFARRYQLDLVGVIEEVPSVDPSPRYLARLSRVIRARHVAIIFTEPQFNPRLAHQLGRDLKVSVAELDVLETGSAEPSFYEEAMRRNLHTLQSTLGH